MLMMTPEFSRQLRADLAPSVMGSDLRRQVRAGLAVSEKSRQPVITLAHQKPKATVRKLNRDRKERLLNNVITILKTRAWSKFEFEGVCRSGVRSGLCLEGWRWHEADACASDIVSTALNRIGAVRPAWAEGQPEYVCDDAIERTRCIRCGRGISDERRSHGSRTKYCSMECGRAATAEKRKAAGEHLTMLEWLAACSVKSQRALQDRTRECANCSAMFIAHEQDGKYCSRSCHHEAATKERQPRQCHHCGIVWQPDRTSDKNQSFCSRACSGASRAIHHPRPCEQCGIEIKPKSGHTGPQRYCSLECKGIASRKARAELTCKWCSSIFVLKQSADKRTFCSNRCSGLFRGAEKRARFACDDGGSAV